MRLKTQGAGIIKELLNEIKVIDRRLRKVERIVPVEMLTKKDLEEIRKSEAEIRKGKYRTLEQVKRELGME